ncbi:uncharacterized protein hyls1 isoform X1 [Onychostoma macrolepis]|uniref:uncharacterized protein hyls1 isoform X1 n=1 Tax=Onychostoma macrolepis TaxID=369639 RepID=UPI00272D083C|nr:uncharacterized protein hyls1 isoform X1 [Onychostoma macrolepis]
MYNAFDSRWENESKDDEGSLSSSSFWTDQESEGENRANERKPEEDHKDVKECFLMGGDEKKSLKEMLQENEFGKEKYPEEEEERECFIDDENKNSIEITRTRQDKEEEEECGEEEEEEECGEEEEESGEEEEESEEEEEGSRDEKEDLCEQQTGNEEEEEDDAKESEEEEKGKELEEEEEFELCEQGKGNKEEESEESEEEDDMSEDEKDCEEEKESSASAENTEENEETKAQSDDSEGEKDQECEEEESFSKEDSKSEEKCTGELSECEEKKESLTKEESTTGSGEENSQNEGDSEGAEGKRDGGKSLVKEERTRNSESEGSENSKQKAPNNEEEEQKDSTEEIPDSDEERNCGNEYDEEIGKSRPGADECDNWMEEVTQHNSGEEADEVSKGGSEEEEERGWLFSEPVEEKEACDQDRKSWASDDDYVTIASGHSQKDEEENYNMRPAWEQERDDVQQTKETRDVYVEDFHESLGSPAASVLTSGYDTYRPDSPKDGDPEEVDYRDDSTLAGLEEESESIFQALETPDGQAPAESPDASQDVTVCTMDGSDDDSHRSPDFPNREHQTDLCRSPTQNDTGTQHGGSENVADFTEGWEVEDLRDSLDHPFNLRHRRGIVQKRPEEKQYNDGYDDSKKRRKEKRVRAYAYTGCLGTVSELEERLDQMRIGASRVHYDSESEETGSYTDRSSSVTEEPQSAFREYIKGMTRSHSESDIRPRPKSFIRPVFDHPHTRNLKKNDPVAKYFQYKQDWEMFKPPGEKSRKELHWAIREQLMYQPPPPRPQKTYIPNNYVVPTEKKRSALRWEIRHDLAHGIIPTKISYP